MHPSIVALPAAQWLYSDQLCHRRGNKSCWAQWTGLLLTWTTFNEKLYRAEYNSLNIQAGGWGLALGDNHAALHTTGGAGAGDSNLSSASASVPASDPELATSRLLPWKQHWPLLLLL